MKTINFSLFLYSRLQVTRIFLDKKNKKASEMENFHSKSYVQSRKLKKFSK